MKRAPWKADEWKWATPKRKDPDAQDTRRKPPAKRDARRKR
jgi:hypothetical protein